MAAVFKLVCPKCGSASLQLPENTSSVDSFYCSQCAATVSANDLRPQIEKKVKRGAYNLSEHKDHAAALGELVASWANVESALCLNLAFLLRCAPWHASTAYYSIVNNNARIEMMRALSKYMIGADSFQKQLIDLLDRAKKLARTRNGYVHKRWAAGTDAGSVYLTENAELPANTEMRKVAANEMREASAEIMALAKDLSDFCGRYGVAYPLQMPPLSEHTVPKALHRKFSQLLRDQNPDSDPPSR